MPSEIGQEFSIYEALYFRVLNKYRRINEQGCAGRWNGRSLRQRVTG